RSFGTERIGLGSPKLHRDGANVRKIARQRQEIIGKRRVEDLRVLIIDDVVEEDAAQSLHQGPDRLAMDNIRIDRAADILDRDVIENFDVPGAWINRDMAGMGAVAVGADRGRETALRFEAGKFRKGRALR